MYGLGEVGHVIRHAPLFPIVEDWWKVFALQVKHWLEPDPEQVAQVLWQGTHFRMVKS